VIHFGLPVAQFKKKDLLEEQTFALYIHHNPAFFETDELDLR